MGHLRVAVVLGLMAGCAAPIGTDARDGDKALGEQALCTDRTGPAADLEDTPWRGPAYYEPGDADPPQLGIPLLGDTSAEGAANEGVEERGAYEGAFETAGDSRDCYTVAIVDIPYQEDRWTFGVEFLDLPVLEHPEAYYMMTVTERAPVFTEDLDGSYVHASIKGDGSSRLEWTYAEGWVQVLDDSDAYWTVCISAFGPVPGPTCAEDGTPTPQFRLTAEYSKAATVEDVPVDA